MISHRPVTRSDLRQESVSTFLVLVVASMYQYSMCPPSGEVMPDHQFGT